MSVFCLSCFLGSEHRTESDGTHSSGKILKACQFGEVICVTLANVCSLWARLTVVRSEAVAVERKSIASEGGGEETPEGSTGPGWGGASPSSSAMALQTFPVVTDLGLQIMSKGHVGCCVHPEGITALLETIICAPPSLLPLKNGTCFDLYNQSAKYLFKPKSLSVPFCISPAPFLF